MPEEQTPAAAVPPVAEWELRNARNKGVRTFEQSELSIEGEARLVGLGRKVAVALAETGYSFEEMGDVLSNTEATNWQIVVDVITKVAEYAPDMVADLGTILLGIYPSNEDGTPNPTYEADRLFLRGALNVRKLVEMARVFIAQNDYRRLMAPFGMTLSDTMAALRGAPGGVADTGEPSSGGPIVGTDGSPIELEPDDSTPSPTPPTSEPRTSASATSSEPSQP